MHKSVSDHKDTICKLINNFVTDELVTKYKQVYSILGPGVWLINISTNDIGEVFETLINTTDKSLKYAPLTSIPKITFEQKENPNLNMMYIVLQIFYNGKFEYFPTTPPIINMCYLSILSKLKNETDTSTKEK